MLVMIARRNHDVGQLMLADGLDQALARRTIAVPEVCREARLGGIVGAKIDRHDDDLLCEQVPDGVIAKSFVEPSFLRAAEGFGRLETVGRAGTELAVVADLLGAVGARVENMRWQKPAVEIERGQGGE